MPAATALFSFELLLVQRVFPPADQLIGHTHIYTQTHKYTHTLSSGQFHTPPSRLVDDGCEQNATLFREQITVYRWERLTFSLSGL